MPEVLLEMTSKHLGCTGVCDDSGKLLGIITDGDLRRVLDHGNGDFGRLKISDIMIAKCKTVQRDALAAEVLNMMETHKINALPVIARTIIA